MTASSRLTFTVTDEQERLIEHLKEALGVDASKAFRKLCDCAIDMNPDIAVHLLEAERRLVKLELKSIDQRIKSARNSELDNPFRNLTLPKKDGKSQDVRTLADMSPDEIIDNYLGDVEKETVTGRVARERIRKVIAEHPELLSELPENVRGMFEPRGEP